MDAKIHLTIGNQEIVNLLVEEQVERMREEIDALNTEWEMAVGEGAELADAIRREQAEPWRAQLNALENIQRIKDGVKALTGVEIVSDLEYEVSNVSWMTLASNSHEFHLTAVLSEVAEERQSDAVEQALGIVRTLPIDVPAHVRTKARELTDKCQECRRKVEEIRNKIGQREEIARSALARVTSATLAANPDLMQQVRNIANLVSNASVKLLA